MVSLSDGFRTEWMQ